MRLGIVASRFNEAIAAELLERAQAAAQKLGAQASVVIVPGALEIPLALQWMAQSGRFDALVAVGAVIRGETYHFEVVAGESARGVMDVALDFGLPVANGILTTPKLARIRGMETFEGESFHTSRWDYDVDLAGKIEQSMLDYRPTPKQRSTLELLRYLTIMGPSLIEATKSGNFDVEAWTKAQQEADRRDFAQTVTALEAQRETYASQIGSMSDEDLRGEITMFGRPTSRGAFLVNMVLSGHAAYRTQLFLYLKSCGREELGTSNLWRGADAAAAKVKEALRELVRAHLQREVGDRDGTVGVERGVARDAGRLSRYRGQLRDPPRSGHRRPACPRPRRLRRQRTRRPHQGRAIGALRGRGGEKGGDFRRDLPEAAPTDEL